MSALHVGVALTPDENGIRHALLHDEGEGRARVIPATLRPLMGEAIHAELIGGGPSDAEMQRRWSRNHKRRTRHGG